MKVLLSGYYGFGNVGDESVLQAIIQGLRACDPDIQITVLSASPRITKELNSGVKAVQRYNPIRILTSMLRTNVFISGGGTLFQNVTSTRSFLYYLALIVLAKLLWKKVAIFAQGFGPLQGRLNQFLAALILSRVDLITLRDADSAEALKKLGIKGPKVFVTADPTAVLKKPLIEEGKKILSLEAVQLDRPLLGIAVRSVPQKSEERLYRTLSAAIDSLAARYHFSPVFLLFECPGDMAETSKVINFMQTKSNVIFRITQPDEMLAIIANCDLLIGMRLHALIFAALNEVPLLGLSYDPKVQSFMEEIAQPYIDLSADLDPERLRGLLSEIMGQRSQVKAKLAQKKKELHAQAEMNFKLFFEHFTR